MLAGMLKPYDRAYFDKWYRHPRHSLGTPAELRRKIAMVVAQAEYYLGRPLRNVLDVGCGEGAWRARLRALRPALQYRGLDSSAYVVQRYGRTRGIAPARFGDLESLRFDQRFDLIVCADVLHYVAAAELRRGLAGFDELLGGLAFVEVYTTRDETDGDSQGFIARSPNWYLRAFADAGLLPCGSHCYLGSQLSRQVAALERAQLPPLKR